MAKANRLALSVLVVLFLAAFAAAQSYTVTDLGPGAAYAINNLGDVLVQSGNSFVWAPDGSILTLLPLAGDSSTTPNGINRQGLAAGVSYGPTEAVAVLWTNGVPLDLGTLGGTDSVATGINASGEVAGYSDISSGSTEAFVWSKATGMQGLGLFTGGDYSLATAINRFGQVAGYGDVNGGSTIYSYAFIWSKTTGMQSLGRLPGDTISSASAINDLGQVAGDSSFFGARAHATLWGKAKGSMLDLGLLPGATYSTSTGINNVGQVVGVAFYADYSSHAFVWNPSTGMLDLNHLIPANSGWVLEFATAINDQGQIVGFGTFNGFYSEAFLLTPQ